MSNYYFALILVLFFLPIWNLQAEFNPSNFDFSLHDHPKEIMLTTAKVGDFVFRDNNSNGIQDAGETGLAGVLVVLRNIDNNQVKFAISKSNGSFIFNDLIAGNYTLKFSGQPTDLVGTDQNQGTDTSKDSDIDPITRTTPSFALTATQVNLDMDAGFRPETPIICSVDADNDGVCQEEDCDDSNAAVGAKQAPGTTCNDGDGNTINDVIQADSCTCVGIPDIGCTDADNDGICQEEDCDDSNAAVGAKQAPGTTCDDGDVNTINDVIQADSCTCAGIPDTGCTDADNDGVCQEEDCDDSNAAIGAKQAPGTTCNDGDANTINDVIQADSCTCAGIPDIGGDPDCEDVMVAVENGTITIEGLTAPIVLIKVFDKNNGWAILFECFNDCDAPTQIVNLGAGDYAVQVQFYNETWGYECEKIFDVTVGGNGCTDNDSDGVCQADDCDDNNASIGAKQAQGTSCDDGNPNTSNDVIQADECTCAGTPDTSGDCSAVGVSTSDGKITVSGLTAPIVAVKVFDKNNGWAIIHDCFNDCDVPVQMVNTVSGDYNVQVQFYTANWGFICEDRFDVSVGGNGCTDSDNDGVCQADDCDDNNASIGAKQPQGTSCDDGNANTSNDVIQGDECTCAGTPNNGNPNCDDVIVTTESNQLKISNLIAPRIIVNVLDKGQGYASIFECLDDCDVPMHSMDLPAGDYLVKVQFFEENWSFLCEKTFDVTIPSGSSLLRNVPISDLISERLVVYPNPVQEELFLKMHDFIGKKGTIQMMNLYGQSVLKMDMEEISTEVLRIDLSKFQNGLYHLNLTIENKQAITKKILVSRMY